MTADTVVVTPDQLIGAVIVGLIVLAAIIVIAGSWRH